MLDGGGKVDRWPAHCFLTISSTHLVPRHLNDHLL